MLTTSAAFPAGIKRYIEQNDTFKAIYAQFCKEVTQDGFYCISIEKQSQIYHAVQEFAPFSHNANVIPPTTMVQWLQTLACFSRGDIRGSLLKETAQAMFTAHTSYNLEQLTTVLNQLTNLLYQQSLDRQLYSEEDPIASLADVMSALHNLILQVITIGRNGTSLSPAQITTVLSAMSHNAFILTNVEADTVFTVLAQNIQYNIKKLQCLSDSELRIIFWSLRHSQGKESESLENLMQVLLPLLLNAKMENITEGVLPYIICSLKYRPNNVITIAILENAVTRINGYTAAHHWIPFDRLSQIVTGLTRMGKNTATEALLTSLLPHFNQLTNPNQSSHIQPVSLHKMGMILEGLQQFNSSKAALSILEKLTLQLAPPSYMESETISLEKWLANIIYSLSAYLDKTASSEAQACAMVFINTAVKKLNLKPKLQKEDLEFTLEDLSDQKDRELLIMNIGNFTDDWALNIDLSGYTCSRGLVRFIAEFIQQLEHNGEVNIPTTARPVHFNYCDDELPGKARYDLNERQWIIGIFTEFFSRDKEKDISSRSTLSISSAASSASPAEQGSTEDIAGAASP